ncbi:MAG: sigma-70 family RNA polymerase sigma factor [Acidimicrobiales bacterium]
MSEESAIAFDDDDANADARLAGVNDAPDSPEEAVLPPEVSQVDFDALLVVGREKGQLTQDELIDTLHAVELTAEVLEALLTRLQAEGVALVIEEVEEEEVVDEVALRRASRAAARTARPPRRETNGKRQTSESGESGGSAEDPVHTYLKEIGRVPLLNAELEVEIAQAIEAGNEAALLLAAHELAEQGEGSAEDLLDTGALSRHRRMARKGQMAKDELIEANLRLVVSIAKRYRNQGLPFLDLIQEGTIGLVRAAEKFDWRRGYKFSTYATWWIRQAVARALADKARTIRMPVHVVEKLNKIVRVERKLRSEQGREPTNEEIARELDLTVAEVDGIRRTAQAPISLSKPIGDDDESEFGHFLEDEHEPAPDDAADATFRTEALAKCLGSLSYRERRVLELRFGLNGEHPCTLDEVGRQFDVTRERIRQIENQSLKKLRALSESQMLRDVA